VLPFLSAGNGVLRYPVPKWLFFLNQCGWRVDFIACVVFLFISCVRRRFEMLVIFWACMPFKKYDALDCHCWSLSDQITITAKYKTQHNNWSPRGLRGLSARGIAPSQVLNPFAWNLRVTFFLRCYKSGATCEHWRYYCIVYYYATIYPNDRFTKHSF
jgi:hypothetical protein